MEKITSNAENSTKFYNGTKLLSMQDIDGRKPEIFMATTNKSGGKTTWFSHLITNKFRKETSKFMVLNRFNYELCDCADKLFKDIKKLYYPNDEMTYKEKADGKYAEFYWNNKPCGYCVALNDADQIKKMSHLFSDVDRMFMDEFQSETNHYCDREIIKFRMIHTAVARGNGQQSRYVPVYMCSNPVTILNPYFNAFGVNERLRKDTKFLRGKGWVLEQGYVESAAKAQKESAFNSAFGDDTYNAYQIEGLYLDDNTSFIDQPKTRGRYLATIRYNNQDYGIREYMNEGVVYCDNRADLTFPIRLAVTTNDHRINYVMLSHNSYLINTLRYYFEMGSFRFKNLQCKEAILKTLSY